jgi:hypothetical protein
MCCGSACSLQPAGMGFCAHGLIGGFFFFFGLLSGSLSFPAALCVCPNSTLLRIQREGSGGFDHNFLILLAA